MNVLIAFFITVVVIALIARLYVVNDKMIQFYSKGLDSNFKLSEINTLWKLAKKTELEDPVSLFISFNILNNCIAQIITEARQNGTSNSFKMQQFLTKLYDYRTRITLDAEGKKGMENTRHIDIGQRLRIILPGKGVFASKLLSNGENLIVTLPRQEDKKNHRYIVIEKDVWKSHNISVYFWRKGDAGYAFDTEVVDANVFQGQECLYLKHSEKLDRTQKRQSVRVPCNFYAQMYFIKEEVVDYNSVNTDDGFRCLLEDISEDGALIRIGGEGKPNIKIKLQFDLNGTFIMMYGVVRAVEYNKEINQARMHFECTHIEPAMRNSILAYVYNVLPDAEKEKNEALAASENDEKEDEMEKIVSGSQRSTDSGEDVVPVTVVDAQGTVLSTIQPEKKDGDAQSSNEVLQTKGSEHFGMGGYVEQKSEKLANPITPVVPVSPIDDSAVDLGSAMEFERNQ